MSAYEPGQVFTSPYPFVRTTYQHVESDGEGGWDVDERQTWKPGVRVEDADGMGNVDTIADGKGEVILTVVSVHRPGKFQTRVFFTRSWRNPDGVLFGKNKLRVTTLAAFTGYTKGYRHWGDLDEMAGQRIDRRGRLMSDRIATLRGDAGATWSLA